MAITTTSTGSGWKLWRGTEEEVVNLMMTSGIGTQNITGFDTDACAGSAAVLINL